MNITQTAYIVYRSHNSTFYCNKAPRNVHKQPIRRHVIECLYMCMFREHQKYPLDYFFLLGFTVQINCNVRMVLELRSTKQWLSSIKLQVSLARCIHCNLM